MQIDHVTGTLKEEIKIQQFRIYFSKERKKEVESLFTYLAQKECVLVDRTNQGRHQAHMICDRIIFGRNRIADNLFRVINFKEEEGNTQRRRN